MDKNRYAWIRPVAGTFEEVATRVRQELQQQGFGILTEIDLATTFKNKLNVSWPRTLILGACNPPLAHKAMTADADVSVFLPCNVVIRETDGKTIEVAAINPEVLGAIMQNDRIGSVAGDVAARIGKVLDALTTA
ncbi:MAG: DUF302 domain-containing protein [Magnetococcales bacterium]|nr:DUF302 domain-containing protein [Magnetococcales bacterium]